MLEVKKVNHVVLIIILVLMFSDYYLTVWAAILREKGHSNFFEIENYELNPIWQEDIKNKKIFNKRHLLMILFAFCFIIYIFEFSDTNANYEEILLGFLLAHYGMLTGRHISNLLTFSYTKKHPGEIKGKVKQSHLFTLQNSSYQYFVAIIPLVIIAVVNPEPLLIGCAVGGLFNILLHKLWIFKYLKKRSITPN